MGNISLTRPVIVGRVSLAMVVLVVALAAWFRLTYPANHLPTTAVMGDYGLNVALSETTCEERQYPLGFVHPLPAVLFWKGLDSFGFVAGASAWLLIVPASLLSCLWLAKAVAGLPPNLYGELAMALSFFCVEYYALWDLDLLNFNSFYLALVLLGILCWQKKRPVAAGVLLGMSVALKVYSIAFLPYFIFRKEWHIGLAMVCSIGVFFTGVPILYLGWHDAILLTQQWFQVVMSTFHPGYEYPGDKVSLSWVMTVLLSPEPSNGTLNVLNCSAATIAWVVRIICAGWGFLALGYFAHTSVIHRGRNTKQKLAVALDSSVLLLCLLPASAALQPHHLVVLLLPATVLLLVLIDKDFPKRVRTIAGLTVGLGAALTESSPHNMLHGIGVLLTLAVYLAGIWAVRCGTADAGVTEDLTRRSKSHTVPGTLTAG